MGREKWLEECRRRYVESRARRAAEGPRPPRIEGTLDEVLAALAANCGPEVTLPVAASLPELPERP